MLTLFGNLDSGNVHKVQMILARRGLPFRRVDVRQDRGQPRDPRYLALNAMGKVPALLFDDGDMISDSGALLFHFARGTPLWPDDGRAQTEVLRWMFFEQYSHEPFVATPRYICRHFPAEHPRRAELPGRLEKGHAALKVMEEHLATRQFFVDERYSIADIALYAYTHVAPDGGLELTEYPKVREWLARVVAQPNYVQLLAVPNKAMAA